MKQKSLMRKSLTQFIICVTALMILAAPLFYLLTENYYAEDMKDVIEAVQRGEPVPSIDMEEDIMHGIMIQFVIIAGIMVIAIVLMLGFISKRLWRPFDRTLQSIETFSLEDGRIPALPDSGIEEFSRLNTVLDKLMTGSMDSYRSRKEFTENASHELQTPLAVLQSKLDLLLQQPQLTVEQAAIIQDLYQMSGRLSRLNRNLLLLAKVENGQFDRNDMDVVEVMDCLQPYFENLAGNLTMERDCRVKTLTLKANRTLFESLVSNLVVNAVRHNRPGGTVTIFLDKYRLTVSNTSDEAALNPDRIFDRFYRPSEKTAGNGLGLAIAKAICDWHRWLIDYTYRDGIHSFTVHFSAEDTATGTTLSRG